MSRVLVTGSRGTVGRKLCEELRKRGHEVLGCDLMHSGEGGYIRADVASYRQLERAFDVLNPDYVYHLAAEFGRMNGEQYYEQVWEANAIGTRHVLELCREYNSKLIFASSSEIYGDTDEPLLSEEMDQIGVLTNDYAISKWTNELQIRSFVKRHGTEVMTLRFFNSYGPGEHYHPFRSVCALFCHAALRPGETITVYKGYHRVFMYIEDFIPTLANCCEPPRFYPGETINIGGDEYRSVEDVAYLAFAQVQRDYLTDPNVFIRDKDIHNVTNKRPNIRKAQVLLGHDPKIKLEVGIPATMTWMAKNAT